jgi:hypothetical protein
MATPLRARLIHGIFGRNDMRKRTRLAMGLMALAVGGAMPGLVRADTITAKLENLNPYVFGSVHLSGAGTVSGGIGNIIWQGASANPAPFNGPFNTYCIDLLQDINFGGTYTFTTAPLQDAPQPGAYPAGGPTNGMGTAKADEIEALFGVDYGNTTTGDGKEAFQLAIWNIIYDTDASVSTGTFYVESGASSNVIGIANGFLTDALNPTNQKYDQTDLVALIGNNGAQDQIAINPLIPINGNATPLPPEAASGLLLFGVYGLTRWRKRRTQRDS